MISKWLSHINTSIYKTPNKLSQWSNTYEPVHDILLLFALLNNEGSCMSEKVSRLTGVFVACNYKTWMKTVIQTKLRPQASLNMSVWIFTDAFCAYAVTEVLAKIRTVYDTSWKLAPWSICETCYFTVSLQCISSITTDWSTVFVGSILSFEFNMAMINSISITTIWGIKTQHACSNE